MKYRARHVAEYMFLRACVGIIRILPYGLALGVGWLMAAIAFHVFRFRRRQAIARIAEVFGDQYSPRGRLRIAWISLRNFAFCAVDMIRIPSITVDWMSRHVSEHEQSTNMLAKHAATGTGAILACPHMGSWEIAGIVAQLSQLPIFFITGKQKNPIVDRYLNRLRGSTGIPTVQRGSSLLKSVIRRLKNGEILGFMPDVRMLTEGVKVTFFGKEANVVGGMGLFARQTRSPIFPTICTRVGWTHHRMRCLSPVWPDLTIDKQQDWQRMTQLVFNEIEAAIREHPEQWFWFNKRWILDPYVPSSQETAENGKSAEPIAGGT